MLASFVGLLAIKATAGVLALRLTGLNWQSAAGMGLGLAHVGEFAFVLLLGAGAEIIGDSEYQQCVVLAVGSLTLTPVLLKVGLRWTRTPIEGDGSVSRLHSGPSLRGSAIVIGAGPLGRQVASLLETAGASSTAVQSTCILSPSRVFAPSPAMQRNGNAGARSHWRCGTSSLVRSRRRGRPADPATRPYGKPNLRGDCAMPLQRQRASAGRPRRRRGDLRRK